MNIALWLVQVVLAVMFAMAGFAKGFTPLPELAIQMAWTADVPAWAVQLPGFSEMVASAGLILPAATRILPKVTPLAGAGLALVMMLALIFHLSRAEFLPALVNLVLCALSLFVVYGRLKLAPISPRAASA